MQSYEYFKHIENLQSKFQMLLIILDQWNPLNKHVFKMDPCESHASLHEIYKIHNRIFKGVGIWVLFFYLNVMLLRFIAKLLKVFNKRFNGQIRFNK